MINPQKKRILLVNPLSSATFLSAEFEKYSIHTTALFTLDMTLVPKYVYPASTLFDEQIFFKSIDVKAIIAHLANKRFDLVLGCFDGDVSLTDWLAIHYSPQYANNPSSAPLRFDKFLIQQALKKNGLSYIKQEIYEYGTTLPNLANLGLAYPCFVKPQASAASIGAAKINNDVEMEKYFQDKAKFSTHVQIINSNNKFIIAELVTGNELFIDTFSMHGTHYISSIHQYYKEFINNDLVCRYSEIVNDPALINKVSEYIYRLLNLVEFNNGFAHTEIFITPNGEIKLIEINPRISGAAGFPNKMAQLAGRPSQVDLLLMHCFSLKLTVPQNIINYTRLVILYNFSNRPLAKLREKLSNIPNIIEFKLLKEDSYIQKEPSDLSLFSALVFVIVGSNTYPELEKTTEKLLLQDKNNWSD